MIWSFRKELGIDFYAWTWEKIYLNDLVFVDDFQCNDLIFVNDFQCHNDLVLVNDF